MKAKKKAGYRVNRKSGAVYKVKGKVKSARKTYKTKAAAKRSK
jgi:hypothetical protein